MKKVLKMCHIFLTARVIYLGREFSGIYGLWPPLLPLKIYLKKIFFYINIIKFEHISSFFFYHWNFPRKIIGSTSWMMMKFGSADVLLIFKYLLKSLTPRSTKIPLSLMCCFRNLSVLLFQVARAELWKAVQALIYLSGLPSALPPSFRS